MKQFVDREEELATLQAEYERSGSSLVILYGRRRTGKTTLVSEFIKDKNALFFLASEESEAQNRTAFKEKAAEFLDSELLRETSVSSWDVIFSAITERIFDSKPIIVIDEFQYIGRSNPAFPSVFQRIWEEQLKDRSVMVILCGSLISMMESQTLAYDSPLYGRRTAQIRLGQIPFRCYGEFFPGKSRRELIERYAVTGGIPKYIEMFSDDQTLRQVIRQSVLNRSGYLYDEPQFLLRQEVSEIGSYFSVIRAIAAGNHKLSSISSALEIKATSLTKYLKTLIDLDILEREVPVTEENPEKSKRGLYKIKDNYLRFWFAYVYPNKSLIESGHSGIVLDKIEKGIVTSHTAFVYEDVCREKMWDLNAEDAWPFHFTRLGRFWEGDTEIDIAALDAENKNLVLGECKYWQTPVGANVLGELEQKATAVPWEREHRRVWYVTFSTGGFTEELHALAAARGDVLLVDDGSEDFPNTTGHLLLT